MARTAGTLTVRFQVANADDAGKLMAAAQLARDLADDQPWNHEANEIATLIEEGVNGLMIKVER